MGKKSSQDPVDPTLQQKIRQWIVAARAKPTEKEPNPKVISMRVFAPCAVRAKSRFWYQLRKINRLKKANGQEIYVREVFEKKPNCVRTYGIVLRYQSRTAYHNMYREYRDVTLNGAMSQLSSEMTGNHRANLQTVQIIRTSECKKYKEMKRDKPYQWRKNSLKFPITKSIPRASEKRFRSTFKATKPTLFR